MIHLNVTFPEDLKLELDSQAKREHIKRSTMIQKAVRVYLGLKKKKSLEDAMRKGYLEMADEHKAIMKDFESLDRESLKYVD